MFERFTDQTRHVLVLAQEEARQLGHDFIGTEHLLLGLLQERGSIAAVALAGVGVEIDATRNLVQEAIGRARATTEATSRPLTPRAKKALELSLREALQRGHSHIGPEHILLGLIRENDGVACQILVASDVNLGHLRSEILRAMGADASPEDDEDRPATPRRLRGPLAHPELDDRDPYRVLERLWLSGMIRRPVTPKEQPLWDQMVEEFGEVPGTGRPTTRLTGLARAIATNVDLGEIVDGHRIVVTGVTVQGSADLPVDLAGTEAQVVAGLKLDDPDQELVTCDLVQDEIRYRVEPPFSPGEDSDRQIIWAWEFSDDLGTDYGGFGNSIGKGRDGTWSRTIGARVPANAAWLEVRYPISGAGDARSWSWRSARIQLDNQPPM